MPLAALQAARAAELAEAKTAKASASKMAANNEGKRVSKYGDVVKVNKQAERIAAREASGEDAPSPLFSF